MAQTFYGFQHKRGRGPVSDRSGKVQLFGTRDAAEAAMKSYATKRRAHGEYKVVVIKL